MNTPSQYKVFARREAWFGNEVAVTIGKKTEGSWAIMMPAQWKECFSDMTEPEPSMRINRDCAQAIMDELWNVGIRPTDGAGSAGQMAATERHLSDMRSLVSKAFKTSLK